MSLGSRLWDVWFRDVRQKQICKWATKMENETETGAIQGSSGLWHRVA